MLCGASDSRGIRSLLVVRVQLNSLVYKLLHASTLFVLGRQHLWDLKLALRVHTRLRSSMCVLQRQAQEELRWWISRLRASEEEGVPLASKSTFPCSGDPSVIDSYSDASRELKSASTSGYGACGVSSRGSSASSSAGGVSTSA